MSNFQFAYKPLWITLRACSTTNRFKDRDHGDVRAAGVRLRPSAAAGPAARRRGQHQLQPGRPSPGVRPSSDTEHLILHTGLIHRLYVRLVACSRREMPLTGRLEMYRHLHRMRCMLFLPRHSFVQMSSFSSVTFRTCSIVSCTIR